INAGEIRATANTGTIVLNQYIANLPTPVTIQASQVNLISQIAPLLEESPDLRSVISNIDADLLVAGGTVKAQGSLQNNQWQGNIQGNNLQPALLSPQLPANLEPVATNIQVLGNIQPLIQQQDVPIQVERVTITSGQQYLNATGDLILANLQTNPDIANIALAIDTNLNFNQLSLQDYFASNDQSLTTIPTILGQAAFTGNLSGKNLLSNPTQPGNLFLTGDITLTDFAINNTEFDPVMTGEVNLDPNARIALAIRGQEDIIAATAEPCTSNRCRFPYLPTTLDFRINAEQDNSIIATGNRQGDVFNLNIANFPLAILNITPAKPIGLDSPVGGIVTGDVGVNLFSLGTNGNITVEKPGVGYIEADKFVADFNYNAASNLAEVATATLLLKDSEYNFNGAVDLDSGIIQGQLNIPQAYIQDILTTLRWYSIADATDLFNLPEPASFEAVDPRDIETVGESIRQKLQVLQAVEQRLQAIAAANNSSNIPTQLDIEGAYTGEVLIAGTITEPIIDFAINAQDWQWKPQETVTTVTPTQGLVKQNSQVIAIPQIQLQGEVNNNVLNLDTARLQVEDATFLATGTLSTNQQDANFEVNNLTVDTIAKFVTIPVDVTGTINTEGTLTGTLAQPQVVGDIVFADGTYNRQDLPETIAGSYIYQNQKLNFNTTTPESIQVLASVPYPIEPGVNDQFSADVKLTTEAFKLLGALTQNNLTWVGGEADAEIVATANINLNQDNPLNNLQALGEVNLNQAQVKNANIVEPITATGTVNLNNQIINVETLNATVGGKDLAVTGQFPLFDAVNNLENPLTVNIPPGEIELEKLYEGEVAGNIVVTGIALEPILSGVVALEDGEASIPQNNNQVDTTTEALAITETEVATSNNNNQNPDNGFQVLARDFLIQLDDFQLQQQPLYEFRVEGELNLNGPLTQIRQLRGDGTIKLVRADVDWLANNFTLVRNRENLIVFSPEANITNPDLNIQLRTEAGELNQNRQLEAGANEVSDEIAEVNRTETVDIRLTIDGNVEEILPNLAEVPSETCQLSPDTVPPTGDSTYSSAELAEFTNCFNLIALESNSDRQLLDSPAITLSSTPERSQGEIVNLLGNQFLSYAEQLENGDSNDLVQLGFNQFIINPIRRNFLYSAEDFIVGVGKDVGLDYLRLFPYAEGVYKLDQNLAIRAIYDYRLFEPEGNSTEANSTQSVFELKLEYRLKF
ncbi:MAG TPA: translocation/assembly module TamB domain-containing protein, partial [Xenococcaceae cyanobacterium]